ncbi:hypothetical protein D3C81_1520070 [compost metagenome]
MQDLVEQDRRHLFHGRTCDLFAGQVQHQHCGRKALGYVRQQGLGLLTFETILEVLDEWNAINGNAIVKCQAQILGERALTRAIEARHRDADFVFATNVHGGFHLEQEILKLLVDAVGNHVFRDFRFQARLL